MFLVDPFYHHQTTMISGSSLIYLSYPFLRQRVANADTGSHFDLRDLSWWKRKHLAALRILKSILPSVPSAKLSAIFLLGIRISMRPDDNQGGIILRFNTVVALFVAIGEGMADTFFSRSDYRKKYYHAIDVMKHNIHFTPIAGF